MWVWWEFPCSWLWDQKAGRPLRERLKAEPWQPKGLHAEMTVECAEQTNMNELTSLIKSTGTGLCRLFSERGREIKPAARWGSGKSALFQNPPLSWINPPSKRLFLQHIHKTTAAQPPSPSRLPSPALSDVLVTTETTQTSHPAPYVSENWILCWFNFRKRFY